MDLTLGLVGDVVQLAISGGTLVYIVFGLGSRLGVLEFQVGELWRSYRHDVAVGREGRHDASDQR